MLLIEIYLLLTVRNLVRSLKIGAYVLNGLGVLDDINVADRETRTRGTGSTFNTDNRVLLGRGRTIYK